MEWRGKEWIGEDTSAVEWSAVEEWSRVECGGINNWCCSKLPLNVHSASCWSTQEAMYHHGDLGDSRLFVACQKTFELITIEWHSYHLTSYIEISHKHQSFGLPCWIPPTWRRMMRFCLPYSWYHDLNVIGKINFRLNNSWLLRRLLGNVILISIKFQQLSTWFSLKIRIPL